MARNQQYLFQTKAHRSFRFLEICDKLAIHQKDSIKDSIDHLNYHLPFRITSIYQLAYHSS